jgi:hypothetical protein
MRTYILTILWLFAASIAYSQSFEGIIEMSKESGGIQQNIKWYIRKDKIAFEISTSKGDPAMYRFVPQPEKGNLLIISADNSKMEAPNDQNTITTNFDTRALQIEEKGTGPSSLPEFREVQKWAIRNGSPNTAEADISPEIDVNFSKYAAYFKDDYALQALAQSRRLGFPLNAVTRDKNGNVISRLRVTKVTRTKVGDQYFK